ncbi:glutaredoxin family protein [Marinicella rhabdoformis]|uniref:glutaredoxin family protein n=1 Tax=Marinicella rhabdoformis TaxID=2580566 RepID=UPI0012AEBC8A|nr:glutaredoxin family protein [Marinicella rhabdoformis]
MRKLTLYSRIECPLCEHAAEMLEQKGIAFVEQDIEEKDEWIRLYHVRIPVLSNGEAELNWPFTAEEAEGLL